MGRLVAAALCAGVALIAAGTFILSPAAGMIVGGFELVVIAMFVDDGHP